MTPSPAIAQDAQEHFITEHKNRESRAFWVKIGKKHGEPALRNEK